MKTVKEITERRDIVKEAVRTCRNSLFLPELRKEQRNAELDSWRRRDFEPGNPP